MDDPGSSPLFTVILVKFFEFGLVTVGLNSEATTVPKDSETLRFELSLKALVPLRRILKLFVVMVSALDFSS